MSTMQPPQDEIAAMQATLALHAADLEQIKRQLPEIAGAVREEMERRTAEFTAANERIWLELTVIRERQDAFALAQANTDQEIASIKNDIARIDDNIVRIDDNIARIDDNIARIDDNIVRIDDNIVRIDDNIVRIDDNIVRINGEVASLKEVVNMLVARTDTMLDRMDAMSRTLTTIDSRVGNLTGSRYERRVARNVRGLLRRSIGLSQARVLHRDWGETDDNLIDLLDEADENGVITRRQRDDVLDADIIVAGQKGAGQSAYAVVEIGITVSSIDVNRAARRARTIAGATGDECSAVVVGSEIPDAERERATRVGIVVITVARPID